MSRLDSYLFFDHNCLLGDTLHRVAFRIFGAAPELTSGVCAPCRCAKDHTTTASRAVSLCQGIASIAYVLDVLATGRKGLWQLAVLEPEKDFIHLVV